MKLNIEAVAIGFLPLTPLSTRARKYGVASPQNLKSFAFSSHGSGTMFLSKHEGYQLGCLWEGLGIRGKGVLLFASVLI